MHLSIRNIQCRRGEQNQGGDCLVSGGFVYRGTESAALAGRYLCGDFRAGRLRSMVLNESQKYVRQAALLNGMNIPGFSQETQGEVYALALAMWCPQCQQSGYREARLIAPVDPTRSVVLQRMLASLSVDTTATEVISQWVSEMDACP